MEYLGLSIFCTDEQQAEMLVALLDLQGFEGFEQRDLHLLAYRPSEGFVTQEAVEETLKRWEVEWQWEDIKETNWNAIWEGSFSPVDIDGWCMIRADFHPQPPPGVLDVVITPKMSFGTGHHATTSGMLRVMRTLSWAGKRVLDFGTGTGILAIAAEKLGASDILAVDNDSWALENCRENRLRNACKRVHVVPYEEHPEPWGVFDVVLANINRHVIERHWDLLQSLTKPGARIVLSGFLTQDREAMVTLCKDSGYQIEGIHESHGWLVIQAVRSGEAR